jgi:hypothetical protein
MAKQSEHQLQVQCVKWFRLKYPKLKMLLFSVPNGAMLYGNRMQRVKQWNYLKSEGATKGVSDLVLLVSSGEFSGLCIEMKTNAKHSKQSKEQKQFEAAVINQGFAYVVPRSFDEFRQVVTGYLETGTF